MTNSASFRDLSANFVAGCILYMRLHEENGSAPDVALNEIVQTILNAMGNVVLEIDRLHPGKGDVFLDRLTDSWPELLDATVDVLREVQVHYHDTPTEAVN